MPTKSERAVDSPSAEPTIIDASKANRARFTEPRFITFPLSCREQKGRICDQSMMLFICHASEDKDDFVAPLAAELREKYEVWYDDYELTLGDSLPEKIDDGLKRCDFGIVVLSKAFFAKKKWGRKELDGLIALEVKRGKMILPVLKGVTHDDVEKYSPILASKVTVSDSEGLPKVIEEIQLAVGVSNRQRELTALDIAAQSVEVLRQTVTEHQRAEQLIVF